MRRIRRKKAAGGNVTSSLVPNHAAPFSHLKMSDLTPASDWVRGNPKLKEVTKKYRKDKGKGIESITLKRASKKQSDGVRQIVKKLSVRGGGWEGGGGGEGGGRRRRLCGRITVAGLPSLTLTPPFPVCTRSANPNRRPPPLTNPGIGSLSYSWSSRKMFQHRWLSFRRRTAT